MYFVNFISFIEEFGVGKVVSSKVLNLDDIESQRVLIREEGKSFDLMGILSFLTGLKFFILISIH